MEVDIPGFSNRRMKLTGEVSLTNPQITSLGMTGSMSLRQKNEKKKSIHESFMKNKNRSPRSRKCNTLLPQAKSNLDSLPKVIVDFSHNTYSNDLYFGIYCCLLNNFSIIIIGACHKCLNTKNANLDK